MKDFTLQQYTELATEISRQFQTCTFEEFLTNPRDGIAVLRHDVDRRVENAVQCARVLRDIGVSATFYFRYPKTFSIPHILEIAALGHEVGYHYETLTKSRGDRNLAVRMFAQELAAFREHVPVKTVCMHGSPLSKWDNRDIWLDHSLSAFDLIGEPYLSVNYQEVGYATDTGRSWNGGRSSIRDSVDATFKPDVSSTSAMIALLTQKQLPRRMIFTVHPERWSDETIPWLSQLIGQTLRNQVKRLIRRRRKKSAYPLSRT